MFRKSWVRWRMNLGLKRARGEIIVITEDDIVMREDTIENLVNLLNREGDCSFVWRRLC